jgi:hypothetical protein
VTKRRRPICVSDHAILRFLERAARIRIAALREAIAGCADVGRRHGARIVVVGGVKLVLSRDLSRVVTVLRRDQPHSDFVTPIEVDASIPVGRAPRRRKRP